MMKIKIIAVSKNKFSYISEGEKEYRKRLRSYADVEIITVREEAITGKAPAKIKETEGERICAVLEENYKTIALDVAGSELSSEAFSAILSDIRDFQGGKVQFVIGGPLGLSKSVLERAAMRLSLSKMTFTHQLIRLLLLEQIYRGFEILKGTGYHK